MSSTFTKTISVGFVTALALGVTAVSVFFVGEEQSLWQERTSYYLRFTRADGLAEGAPVTLHGVNVGSVSRLSFPDDPEETYIQVKIRVRDSVAPRIRKDTVGRIQTLGLLGDKYIQLVGGSHEQEPVESYGTIESVEPVDYEAILGRSDDVVSNAIEVTALLREVLTDITQGEGLIGRLIQDEEFGTKSLEGMQHAVASLDSAGASLDSAMTSIQATAVSVSSLVSRIERGEGAIGVLLSEDRMVRATLENLASASNDIANVAHEVAKGKGPLRALAADEALTERLHAMTAEMENTLSNLQEVSAKLNSGQGTLGKLIEEPTLHDEAEALFEESGGSMLGLFREMLFRGDRKESGAEGAEGPEENDDGGSPRPFSPRSGPPGLRRPGSLR